jgi:tetratricopeptide (TPR) repeat protein
VLACRVFTIAKLVGILGADNKYEVGGVAMSSSISALLKKAGFPDFPLDDAGFPEPGSVIRYFREQMRYNDPISGIEKHWTQTDLAKRLGLSEVTVRLMETQNMSLDSISRRRVLADILKIPPLLLGLGSQRDLSEFLNGLASTSHPSTSSLETETIDLYRQASNVYGEMHLTGTAQDSITSIKQWMSRIKNHIDKAKGDQRSELQDILWSFYDLTAKIYSDDLNLWHEALTYLNAEMELATHLKSDQLRAASLYRSGQIRFAQRQYFAARTDLEGAVQYARGDQVDPQLKSAIFASAGLAFSIVDKSEKGKTSAQSLLEEARTLVTSHKKGDGRFVKFDYGKYLLEYADALIALNRPKTALQALDDASEQIDPALRRRRAYITILQAESYMRLKRPQLDTATDLLTDAFGISQSIKSEFIVGHVVRRYNELRKSPYGNSTDVADLGVAIRDWRKLNH